MCHPIIGYDKELVFDRMLPTILDVLRYYNFLVTKGKLESNRFPPFDDVARVVVQKVESIWSKASIPTTTSRNITRKLQYEVEKLKNIAKSFHRDFAREKFGIRKSQYLARTDNLFDICSCQCQEVTKCSCPKEKKIPKLEHTFIQDQRTTRQMAIAGVDKVTTSKLQKRIERKETRESSCQNLQINLSAIEETSHSDDDSHTANDGDGSPVKSDDSDMEECPQERKAEQEDKEKTHTVKLESFARTCDRFGISDRSAAALASSLIHDIKHDSEESKNFDALVLDRSKVRRERIKTRDGLKRKLESVEFGIKALYFDGRIDDTLHLERTNDNKLHRRNKHEDHLSLIQEPGGEYIGHTSPRSGKAIDIADSIVDYMDENKINLDELVCLGCDGCPTNTGKNNGVLRTLEGKLKRPLQWVICQLHTNELPLRHLIEKFDGKTKGPFGFTGPIGKEIASCHSRDIVQYQPIHSDLIDIIPDLDMADLSTDQRYLLAISKAVITGTPEEGLEGKSPGKLSHARWLTTANRILRLYVSTSSPSSELQMLATFIVKVYAYCRFSIKKNNQIKDGSVNLFKMIQSASYLDDEWKQTVYKCIQDNGYFSHHENILIAMLFDERKHVRELAVRRIMKARGNTQTGVRRFEVPNINFECSNYIDMIKWQFLEVTEPPLTKHVAVEDLSKQVDDINHLRETVLHNLPTNTQAVERCVKEVTCASKRVCGSYNRDGVIRSTLYDRQIRPTFNSKKEFKC